MRALLVLVLVAAAKASFSNPRVVYYDDDLVTSRSEAVQVCMSKGHCIAHESQLIADLHDGYSGHHRCGFTWARDDRPRHAHCIERNDKGNCVKSEIRNNLCVRTEKYGVYCRVQREGENLPHPCKAEDTDMMEIYRLEGPFKNINEAKAGCESHGSELAYWNQVAAYTERYGISFCQYNILRVEYSVYRINCQNKHDIEYAPIDGTSSGYGAICRGQRPHAFHNPCDDKYPNANGVPLFCTPDGWIIAQARPPCELETETFDDQTRKAWEWMRGFGKPEIGYWLGLQHMNQLTEEHRCELMVEVWDHQNNYHWAKYKKFQVQAEHNQVHPCSRFKLIAEDFDTASTAGDAFNEIQYQGTKDAGSYFSDREHDCDGLATVHCSREFRSAWWFAGCHRSNLNGICDNSPYYEPANRITRFWEPVNGKTGLGLRKTRMKIKCYDDGDNE